MADLGGLVGLSQSTISRIEAGKQIPDRDVMRKIFEITDGTVTPNDFVLAATPSPISEQGCAAG